MPKLKPKLKQSYLGFLVSVFVFILALGFGVILFSQSSHGTFFVDEPGRFEGRMIVESPCFNQLNYHSRCESLLEVYATRSLVVFDGSHMKVVASTDLEKDGTFSLDLAPGVYVVDIGKQGIDSSKDTPMRISIAPGQTLSETIRLDPGIK